MPNILSYHVFDGVKNRWLSDTSYSWTSHFIQSASFDSEKLANDIGKREASKETVIYIMACLETID